MYLGGAAHAKDNVRESGFYPALYRTSLCWRCERCPLQMVPFRPSSTVLQKGRTIMELCQKSQCRVLRGIVLSGQIASRDCNDGEGGP